MSSEIKTILLATTPINELRGTIPLAIKLYQLSPLLALILAVIGNMLPILLILWLLPKISLYIESWNWAKKILNWIFKRTRKRFYQKYSLYGDIGLVFFVALPLPLTGAWSGAIAAFLFGIPYWRAIGLIFLGVVAAGLIVTSISIGIFSFI